MLKFKHTYGLCLTRFISDWVWWFFLFWLPDFLKKVHGVDIREVVVPLIIIYTISSFGGILGGWFSSKMIKDGRSINFSRKAAILVCSLFALPIIFVPYAKEIWLAIALISLGTAAHQAWASNMFTIISDIYPKNAVASMVGLAGFAGSIGGALSAWLVGVILQISNNYIPIFIIAGSVYFLNWVIINIFIKDIRPIMIKK
jgi:ACS family hexuronate transporter-like MFS transporter